MGPTHLQHCGMGMTIFLHHLPGVISASGQHCVTSECRTEKQTARCVGAQKVATLIGQESLEKLLRLATRDLRILCR